VNPGVHPNCRRWLACVMKSCHMPRGHKTLTECLQLQWGQGFLTDQQTPGGRGGSRAFLFSVQSRTNRATWNLLEILGPSPPPHQNVHLHEPHHTPPHPTPPTSLPKCGKAPPAGSWRKVCHISVMDQHGTLLTFIFIFKNRMRRAEVV
jgi:hypothetical protein